MTQSPYHPLFAYQFALMVFDGVGRNIADCLCKIMRCGRYSDEGLPIPPEWAFDPDGRPTSDPQIALKGSMAPTGGYKGVGVAMMVEIMAAAMTGATLGINASPFSGTKGGPPKTGQFFLAIDPNATSGGEFSNRLESLVGEMRDQPGVRVPGDGRKAARRRANRHGVEVNPVTLAKINDWL